MTSLSSRLAMFKRILGVLSAGWISAAFGCGVSPAPSSGESTSLSETGTTGAAPSSGATDAEASSGTSASSSSEGSPTTGTDFSTSSSTNVESTGENCDSLELSAITELCSIRATQQTAVSAEGAGVSFSGMYAFFGLGECGQCASLDRAQVYAFEQLPDIGTNFALSAAPMLVFDVDLVVGEFDMAVTYQDVDADVGIEAEPTHVEITAVPTANDFDGGLEDPPRLRVEISSLDPDLEISGTIDAVFCYPAGYSLPCE